MGKGIKITEADVNSISKAAATQAQKDFSQQSMLGQHLETGCAQCPGKDYSEPCPSGWEYLSDGTCKASPDYVGVCSAKQSFVEGSVVEKEEVELICGVCWPCSCERDWAPPCPSGYSLIGNATCSADIGYEGQCEQLVSFKDVHEKMAFAQRCQTSWACK